MNRANYSKIDKIRLAKKMISNPTEAEQVLYNTLSKCKVRYIKQYIVSGYIVDAYLPDVKLALECDGGYHTTSKQQFYDMDRDTALKRVGITTIRFNNDQIINNAYKIIKKIKSDYKIKVIKRKKKKCNVDQDKQIKLIKRNAINNISKYDAMSSMSSSQFLRDNSTTSKR